MKPFPKTKKCTFSHVNDTENFEIIISQNHAISKAARWKCFLKIDRCEKVHFFAHDNDSRYKRYLVNTF